MDAVDSKRVGYWSSNNLTFKHVMIEVDGYDQYSHTNYSLVTNDASDPTYRIFVNYVPREVQHAACTVGSVIAVGGYRFRIVDYDILGHTARGVLDSQFAFLHVWRSQLRHHWMLFKARCAMTRRIWFT